MESYRALGFEIMDTLLQRTLHGIEDKDQSLQVVLTALAHHARGGGAMSVRPQSPR